ncbi:MAG: hypothetical protein GF331_12530 [Chitinivibrionales bacterium]|nr:hypothetical protein [Chitinivibrionales bacterium]
MPDRGTMLVVLATITAVMGQDTPWHFRCEDDCGIGVPSIVEGTWTNRDSIYANCEECCRNDSAAMEECKRVYNVMAEGKSREYDAKEAKWQDGLPALIEISKDVPYAAEMFDFFRRKKGNAQATLDSITMILSLRARDIRALDAWTLQAYGQLLERSLQTYGEYRHFHRLLEAEVPEMSLAALQKEMMSGGVRFDTTIDSQAEYLNALLYFFRRKCEERKLALLADRVKNEPSLDLIAYVATKTGGNALLRVIDGQVADSALTTAIAKATSLDKRSRDIVYGLQLVYGATIEPIIEAVSAKYTCMVVEKTGEEARKAGLASFRSLYPCRDLKTLIAGLERYGVGGPWSSNTGLPGLQPLVTLRRICDED